MWPWPWPDGTINFEHLTLTVTFDLLLKYFIICHNSFILRDGAFICRISDGTINFEHVTLTVTFDLLLKNFNIGHNSFMLRGRTFILGIRFPYDKAFQIVPYTFLSLCVPSLIEANSIARPNLYRDLETISEGISTFIYFDLLTLYTINRVHTLIGKTCKFNEKSLDNFFSK